MFGAEKENETELRSVSSATLYQSAMRLLCNFVNVYTIAYRVDAHIPIRQISASEV